MTEKQYNDYLSHHGILGQKWGKKNGPPYPLDASRHSASEKKAGWRKSLSGEDDAAGKGFGSKPKGTKASRPSAKNLTDEELKRDNTRYALERQYEKNHKDDDDDGLSKAAKVTDNTKTVVNAASKMASDFERATRKTVSTSDIDISKLSDKELQQIVSRMNLEAQYNRMTTKEVYNKGAVATREALEIIGSVVAIAGGVIMIKNNLK